MTKSYKKLTSIFLTLILLFNFISPISMVKANENSNEKTDYKFSFDIYRGSLSKYENLFAVYSNYYMDHPEFDVFDRNEWALKDFEIEYELHTHTGKSIIKKMSYTSEDYSWVENLTYDGITIPYKDVEVQYYKKDNGDFIEPYLLHFDLYLEESNGKMILKVPSLLVDEANYGKSEGAKVIEVKNIQTEEIVYEIYLDGKNGMITMMLV